MKSASMILLGLSLFPASAVLAAGTTEKFEDKIAGTTVTFEMLPIPVGTLKGFKLKKDSEPADVEIKPFFMEKTETRWDQYNIYCYARDIPDIKEGLRLIETKVRPSKPYETPTFNFGDAGYPCLASTRAAAMKYCDWLSEKTGHKYRLPTPQEWEWAARGGAAGDFTPEQIEEMSWNVENSLTDEYPGGATHPVAKRKPNGYGLYDMLGNAAEWVLSPGQDPFDHPTVSGGSWKSRPATISPSYRQEQTSSWNQRDPNDPKSRWWLSDGNFVSFRVVCESK